MKVRNYIVENANIFMDSLEQELCQNGISYVKIDNEIHFLDQIVRFYDLEVDRKEIINWMLLNISRKESERKLQVEYVIFSGNKNNEYYHQNMQVQPTSLAKPYQVRNRFIQKNESHSVKQQLKRYPKR